MVKARRHPCAAEAALHVAEVIESRAEDEDSEIAIRGRAIR